MAIETRPDVNTLTSANPFVGLPFVEFAPETSPGVYDPYRQLGIVDSAELQKDIELLTMRSFQSGLGSVVRELVGSLEARLQVGLYQFDEDNLQLFLGSSSITAQGATTVAVTDDAFSVPSGFPSQFADLTNGNITTEPLTDLDCQTITSENVGTGQGGTFGETQGDFALDFPILVVADVTSYIETAANGTVTDRTGDIVAGASPMAGEIGIIEAAVATSGEITYPSGEAPASGTVITVTYTPSFTFTNGTDYLLDLTDGRIRMLNTNKVRTGQTLIADYSYTRAANNRLVPFTQREFNGRARVKQLTDVGVNFIWTIPKVSVRLTDDPFAWSGDDFARGTLVVNLLDDGTTQPYGTFDLYPETP